MNAKHGQADEAGKQMHSELDAIQERLRALKRKLDARERVIEVDVPEPEALAPTGGKNPPAA